MASTWSQGDWNLGSWNDAAVGAVLTGQSVTTSVGDVIANAEIRAGWSRGTYSSATWNQAPDQFVSLTTVGELETSLNLGFGWGRESWNEGNWNSSLGFVLTGNGNVFATTTAGELTTTANNITVTASAPITIITKDGSTFTAEGTTALSTDQAKFGDASVEFDGTSNQGVQQDNTSEFGSGDFTSEFWIYSSSIRSQSSTLWDFRISGSGLLLTNNNGQISFFKDGSGGSSPTSILTNDTWHHIAIVRTGSTGNVYVDGNLQITRNIGTDDYSSHTLLLGNNVFNSSGYLSGYIDELRNSNIVRYSSNFTPPSSAFTPDANTIDLLHFDGTDGSTTIINSQDITQPVQGTFSIGEETITGTAPVIITGEELLSATVNTFAVAAGGAITINTPTFEANVELNNDGINVGLATFLDVTGFPLSANLGSITTTSENIIPITGEELTTTANTISLSTSQILSMTGNGVTITLADIVPNSENFISIQGNRANANVTTLKFWDPIIGNITETWTNIH